VTVALTRALRFTPGAVLRFTPSINGKLLEAVQSARPQVAELLAAAQAARITVESLDERACGLRVAHFELELVADLAEGYALRLAWTDPGSSTRRNLQIEGIAAMLGGRSDVFFAQRADGANRFLLKLTYEAAGARVFVFPGAFPERIPSALRALLPSQLALGILSAA
jgi:hypothetical protein